MKFETQFIKENHIKFEINIWADENLVWLNHIVVPRKKRNRGLGTKAMFEFTKWLDENKYKSMLLVLNHEEKLIPFYAKFNYIKQIRKGNCLYLLRE